MGISDDIKKSRKNNLSQPVSRPEASESTDESVIELPANNSSSLSHDQEINDNKVDDPHDSFFKINKNAQKSSKHSSKIIIVILILAIFVMIGFAVYQNIDLIKDRILKIDPVTSETNISNIDADTTNQEQPTSPSETAATESTTQPAPVVSIPEIDKQSFKIRVSNGNGIKGSAYKITQTLTTAGFKVTSTGNADRYNYATSIIYYKAGKEKEADLVKSTLPTLTSATALSSTLTLYDILVVVGVK